MSQSPEFNTSTLNGHPVLQQCKKKRLIILGAGFGGLYAALHLEKRLRDSDELEIILINKDNYFVHTPMLPEVTSGVIETRHILVPLRELCHYPEKAVRFIRGDIFNIDLAARHIDVRLGETGQHHCLEFDYLLIALGSTVNLDMVSGAKAHALPMKDAGDAMMIRNQVIEMFERADVETNPSARRAMLTFTIAGAGFSGVEIAASLHDLVFAIAGDYPTIQREEIRVIIVEGRQRILMELNERLALYAQKVLEKTRLEIILGQLLSEVSDQSIRLSGGEEIPTRTVIWTTGVAMDPMIACLPCEKDQRRRLRVNEFLEVLDYPNIWAVGDCALIQDHYNPGGAMAPTAQNALREAKIVAGNILASVRQAPAKRQAFAYKPIGEFVLLGRREAVAQIQNIQLSGWPAWMLWRMFYLWRLPSGRRRVQVFFDWLIDAFSRRDTTQIKLLPSEMLEDRLHELEETVDHTNAELLQLRTQLQRGIA